MDAPKFKEKYKDKGGMNKLTELRSLFFGQKYIAKHFGVSQESVRNWMLGFFGRDYDPREDRKDAIILSMIEFARHNSITDFDFAYKGTQYYKEVLEKCNKLKIYDTK